MVANTPPGGGKYGQKYQGTKTALCCPEEAVFLSIKLLKAPEKDEVTLKLQS